MTGVLPALAAAAGALAPAYVPFRDPIDVHGVWFLLLIPLAIGIGVVFRALRTAEPFAWRRYGVEVAILASKVVLAMIGLAIAAHLFVRVLLPLAAPMPAGH